MADEELENLPPEERIRRLKKIEEKKKKEIEEAHRLIQETEIELDERKKFKEKVPIPQVAVEDLSGLSKDEKEILRVHKGLKEEKEGVEEKNDVGEESVEDVLKEEELRDFDLEMLAKERVDLPPEVMQSEYTQQLSQRPMQDLYQEMTNLHKEVTQKGYISQEEEKRVEYLSSAVEKKVEDFEEGVYTFSGRAALAANLTRQVGAKLRNMYQGSSTSYKSG